MSPERLEHLRRSVAMLRPTDRSGLDRETALALCEEVQRLQGADKRLRELLAAADG